MTILDHVNPHIAQLRPYQPGKTTDEIQRTYHLSKTVKLASNECPLPPSQKVSQAIINFMPNLARYPEDAAPRLRGKLADLNQIPAGHITFGSGSSEILELLIRSFTQPGDNIITSEHAFALYKILAKAAAVESQLIADQDWQQNLDGMLAAINDKTRIIFVTNPNNPTGTWVRKTALYDFIKAVPTDVLIVVDEAYTEFMDQAEYASAMPLLSQYDNLVVVRTFSKAYALAGLRFGYGMSSAGIADILNRIRKPFNVSAVTLAAAEAALDDVEYLQQVIDNNRFGMSQFKQFFDLAQLPYIDTTGNFMAVEFGDKALDINQAMLERGVILRPLVPYNMPEYLRISIGLPEENQICIEQLSQVLQAVPA